MTDEEKVNNYELDCIADVYKDDVCTIPYAYSAQKLEQAYLDGLAEGRKLQISHLLGVEKENAELKKEIEKLKVCGSCKYVCNSAHEEPCIHCANCFDCVDKSVNKWELAEGGTNENN